MNIIVIILKERWRKIKKMNKNENNISEYSKWS